MVAAVWRRRVESPAGAAGSGTAPICKRPWRAINRRRRFADQLRSGLFPSLRLRADGVSGAAVRNESAGGPGCTALLPIPMAPASRRRMKSISGVAYATTWHRGGLEASAAAADLESARLEPAGATRRLVTSRFMAWIVKPRLLADTVAAYDRALALTKERHQAGIVSGLDVARAQTSAGDGAFAECRRTRRSARRWNTRSPCLWVNRRRSSLLRLASASLQLP